MNARGSDWHRVRNAAFSCILQGHARRRGRTSVIDPRRPLDNSQTFTRTGRRLLAHRSTTLTATLPKRRRAGEILGNVRLGDILSVATRSLSSRLAVRGPRSASSFFCLVVGARTWSVVFGNILADQCFANLHFSRRHRLCESSEQHHNPCHGCIANKLHRLTVRRMARCRRAMLGLPPDARSFSSRFHRRYHFERSNFLSTYHKGSIELAEPRRPTRLSTPACRPRRRRANHLASSRYNRLVRATARF